MQTVSELRKEGLLDEALEMVERSLAKKPDNLIAKRDKAWILQDMMGNYCSSDDSEAFADCLDRFKDMNLPEDEVIIYDNLAWQIGKFLMELSKVESDDPDFVAPDPFIERLKSFQFTKPSESYSFLLRAVSVHHKHYNGFADFVMWWGFDNFRESDYAPRGKEGNMDSFVESIFYPMAKLWFDEEKEAPTKEILDTFILAFQKAIDQYPRTFKLGTYYLSRLYYIQGNLHQAKELMIGLLRYRRGEYLLWEMLGDVLEDKDLKIAAYCKAVNCKAKQSHLFRVREKLVSLLAEKGLYAEAKTTLQFQLKMYQKLERHTSEEVTALMNQDWYSSAESLPHNEAMYVEYLPKIDAMIFPDIKEQVAVVSGIKQDKSLAYFRVSKKIEGSFPLDSSIRFVKGDIIAVRLERKVAKNGFWYKTLSVKRSDGRPKRTIYKFFEGQVPAFTDNGCFIGEVFLDPYFLREFEIKTGDRISGAALAVYNTAKDEWLWKAVKYDSKA